MKRATMLILMMMLVTGIGFGQEYGDYEPYDNDTYADYDNEYLTYDYGYDSARPYLQGYDGPVYYWTHPYRDVYFVLIGRRVFVIPVYELNSIWHRLRWSLVSMDRFIHLSCFGMPYYDNYIRFNYYYNHFRRYRYAGYYNRYLRTHYRSYYRNRRHNREYYRHRSRVLRKSTLTSRTGYGSRTVKRRVIRSTPQTRTYSSRRSGSRTYTRSGNSSRRSPRTYTRSSSPRSTRTIRRSSHSSSRSKASPRKSSGKSRSRSRRR